MAATLREEIAELNKVLAADGLQVRGSMGQPVAHWALAQRRASMRLLHVILAKQKKEDDADAELEAFLDAAP